MKAVSNELTVTILAIMDDSRLSDFYLGGGTNLAIKYNHRISTDIDLFSNSILGKEKIKQTLELLNEKFKNQNVNLQIKNKESENLSFITGNVTIREKTIGIDIVQNLKIINPIELKNGIRLINDLDMGSLKLLSAANRGNRKDFYDLYLLSKKCKLGSIYDELLKRNSMFDSTKIENQNIFNIPAFSPKESLTKSIEKLGDFNNANDLKKPGNKIVLPRNSPTLITWVELKRELNKMYLKLSKEKNIIYKPTQNKRVKRNRGFSI